ncbi:DCL family protein [Acinetobacter baumannii]|uniref:DUF3223 domain-containing protein n=1 Tax=Acinetobacter baumannii TaxID=470 RepID=UPI00233F5DA9|nr:DCL family protein [Acinetobacter baumannii]MDC5578929.1 DCL family protein [Acinetobacter baumannii]HCA5184124.1 DUF3223 domain-containing protein [Acinetobacter baumannii]
MATEKWWHERGYKTQKELIEVMQAIIKDIPDNHYIENNKDKEIVIWVLSHHHEYDEKTNYSTDFEIQVRRSKVKASNKELWIIRKDKTEIDISWRKALGPGGASSLKENIRNAAVQAVNDQINAFKDNNTDRTCCLCNKLIEETIEACHFEPKFDQLLQGFFGGDEQFKNIIIKDGKYAHRYFDDEKLHNGWVNYHKSNAILRPAHASCIRKRPR